MAKKDMIEVEGIVIEILPSEKFRVNPLDKKMINIITATISGKIRRHNIRVLKGDRVKVMLSPYDLTTGIIKWRYK